MSLESLTMQLEEQHQELIAKLRKLRQEAGLSTRALAQQTGFSQSKIMKIESGRSLPKSTDVSRLLEVFEVNDEIHESLTNTAQLLVRRKYSQQTTSSAGDIWHCTQLENDSKECRAMLTIAIP